MEPDDSMGIIKKWLKKSKDLQADIDMILPRQKNVWVTTTTTTDAVGTSTNAPWLWGDEKDQKYGEKVGELRLSDSGILTFVDKEGNSMEIKDGNSLEKVKTMTLLRK